MKKMEQYLMMVGEFQPRGRECPAECDLNVAYTMATYKRYAIKEKCGYHPKAAHGGAAL